MLLFIFPPSFDIFLRYMISHIGFNCNTGEILTSVKFSRNISKKTANTYDTHKRSINMENKKEKQANIDSIVASKTQNAQNISIPNLYAHGLEYAENIKKKEAKNKKGR